MRINLATDYKTRTGAPDKDARQKNSYIEVKNEQAIVRKRPSAQGGIAVGTGIAQGGIGLTINGTPYFIGFWADTMQSYTGGGTSWDAGTAYAIGAHVSYEFEDYWALADNTGSQPPSTNWSRNFVASVPFIPSFVWTARTLSSTQFWNDISYGASKFCAISSSSTASTSPDGVTWTDRTMPSLKTWISIAWNGTVFCAIAYDPNFSYAATSSDGISWAETAPPVGSRWYSIVWNGTVFCVLGDGGYARTWTSLDGINWTQNSAPGLPTSEIWNDIKWNGSIFCAVSNNGSIYTSTDAIIWVNRTPVFAVGWGAIAWNGTVFCVVPHTLTNVNSSVSATSPDGITWTQRAMSSSALWEDITNNGSLFCAIGMTSSYASVSATSSDGITWTSRSLPTNERWIAITYGNGLFCTISERKSIGGGSDAAATSPMG